MNDEPPKKILALEERPVQGGRMFSPSAARNRDAVLAVLKQVLPPPSSRQGKVLEIASGTGEHAVHFAQALSWLDWLPSDPDEASRASIEAWRRHEKLQNLSAARFIDSSAVSWGVESEAPFDALISLNMLHIAPWPATAGLFAGARRLLKIGGIVFLYGPFRRGGVHNADSNAAFDQSLKSRNPAWGVRDIDDLEREAAKNGLVLRDVVEMPANNRSLVFVKG
jgi:SAM-dependent methyltransferase